MDKRFVVKTSSSASNQYSVFEEYLYDSGPPRLGEEVETGFESKALAQDRADKLNSELV